MRSDITTFRTSPEGPGPHGANKGRSPPLQVVDSTASDVDLGWSTTEVTRP